ncbi:MAG: choice-of-anchor L domain-containing protein [Bacteroidia bacterium]
MRLRIVQVAAVFSAMITMNSARAQLTVSSATAVQMVDTLLGNGVTASGITYSGYTFSRGTFNGALSNIGFNAGAFLCTGDINMAPGPNVGSSTTLGGSMVTCTDPQLNSIATTTLYDGAVLEFDFVPMSDTIKFRYVFASEEYPEYVCSNFNDVFGFFLSGPNPAGGTYSNVNIATIPGSGGLPVAVGTVNPGVTGTFGSPGGCASLSYSSLYFDNETPPGATVEFDGFTVPMTAIAAVNCGQTYHIKLAVADAGDGSYDSGVFLEAGSFSSQAVTIIPEISYGGANDSTLYEGCGLACVYFVRTSNLSQGDTINVTISGSAVNGVDYNTGVAGVPLPSQLYFAPGQDSISYCINAVSDGVTEGLDTINLAIIQTGICVSTSTYATIYINEYQPLTLSMRDTTLCNFGGTVTLNALVTGGVEPYTYNWSAGLPNSPSQTVTVASTTTYTVTVNDACTSAVDPTPAVTDSATVTVATFAPMVASLGSDIVACAGDQMTLSVSVSGGGTPYIYSWSELLGSDTLASSNTQFNSTMANLGGTYSVTVTDICGNTQSDDINVLVQDCILNIPNIITPDGHGPTTNEMFYIDNLDKFPGAGLQIFNRWGNKIYETETYNNDWNGRSAVDGVYYYILTVPMAKNTLASAKPSSSYKEQKSDDQKIFAGFFQVSRH